MSSSPLTRNNCNWDFRNAQIAMLSAERVRTFRSVVANSYQIRWVVILSLETHLRFQHAEMAQRYRSASIGLPPFLSPLSKFKTEARQTRREHLGRLEWGIPVSPRRSPDEPISRSVHATETADGSAWEEPPELDIGEALLSVPAHETAEDDELEDGICVRMPGRPSPVSVSGHDLSMTTNAGAMSPSSSPRLPSPPPFTEVQIGPKSPTIGASAMGTEHELGGVSKPDMGATRRIRPGTKAADMASGPPLVPLAEVSYTRLDFINFNTRWQAGLFI